jgi:hypothetical protein
VPSSSVRAPCLDVIVILLFSLPLVPGQNKLECLSQPRILALELYPLVEPREMLQLKGSGLPRK